MVTLQEILLFMDSRNLKYIVHTETNLKCIDQDIKDVFSDSRLVIPGSMFCCVKGNHVDGHDFVSDACKNGCVVILCEKQLDVNVTQIIVPSVRETMGFVASFIYGDPSSRMLMVAVTGTNGKSTTTYMIKSILDGCGIKTGILGTILYNDGHNEILSSRTTPESCDVQRYLHNMVINGCKACVMEASSHGLVQGRLNGCLFDTGVFTNITPEHLDYHKTIKNYFNAKRSLFTSYMKDNWKGSVNLDDTFGRILFNEFPERFIPYGLSDTNEKTVTAETLDMSIEGLEFNLKLPSGGYINNIKVPLTGRYNVYNVLASIGAVFPMHIADELIRGALKNMPQVPGRLEKFLFHNGICCVIDYAHTPDALQNVLKALREVVSGQLTVVFGLGGNRYRENRPIMGKTAAQFADKIIVTMDNPRDEDPEQIADQIIDGIVSSDVKVTPYEVIIDRKKAVHFALDSASSSDVVLVAGKGPERFIIWGNDRIPYNDAETVKNWADSRSLGWN